MSQLNEYKEALAVIQDFRKTFGDRRLRSRKLTDKAICEQYGIDRGRFRVRIRGGIGKHDGLQRQFIQLAEDIRRDPNGLADRLVGKVAARAVATEWDDLESMMRQATALASTDEIAASVGLARHALRCTIARNPLAVPRLLPRALYIFVRHAPARQLVHVARHEILGVVGRQLKNKLPTAETAAAIAQLACALNEGGAHQEAMELFQLDRVRRLRDAGGELAWCGPMIIRNEAHAWMWKERLLQRALDCSEDAAQRSATDANKHSVANTICEINLHCERYRAAWEVIQPYYEHIRTQLLSAYDDSTQDFVGPTLPRFQSSFGSLYVAVWARLGMRDRGYSAAQQDEDLHLIEGMLQIDERGTPLRKMLHGGVIGTPSLAGCNNTAVRMKRVSEATHKPRLCPAHVSDIMACVQALREAGDV